MKTLNSKKFVWLPIQVISIRPQYMRKRHEQWTRFDYKYALRKWEANKHYYSPEKDQFEHIYDMLKVGHFYWVLSCDILPKFDPNGGDVKDRWIWMEAIEFEFNDLCKVERFHQQHKDNDKSLAFAVSLMKKVDKIKESLPWE